VGQNKMSNIKETKDRDKGEAVLPSRPLIGSAARSGYCEQCKLSLKTEYGGIYGWCYTCNSFQRVAPIPEKYR